MEVLLGGHRQGWKEGKGQGIGEQDHGTQSSRLLSRLISLPGHMGYPGEWFSPLLLGR